MIIVSSGVSLVNFHEAILCIWGVLSGALFGRFTAVHLAHLGTSRCHRQMCCCHWGVDPLVSGDATLSGVTTSNINTFRREQNGRHFADDLFKLFFLYGTYCIPIKISLKFVLDGPINNEPILVQIMAWRRTGDKQLSEPTIYRPTFASLGLNGSILINPSAHNYCSLPDQSRLNSMLPRVL